MLQTVERRIYPRYPIRAAIEYVRPDRGPDSYAGSMTDLSYRGAQLLVAESLVPSEYLSARHVDYPGAVTGYVRWARPLSTGQYEVGIEYAERSGTRG
jgi:hypothetical protein